MDTFPLCQKQYAVIPCITNKVKVSHQLGHADISFRVTLNQVWNTKSEGLVRKELHSVKWDYVADVEFCCLIFAELKFAMHLLLEVTSKLISQ